MAKLTTADLKKRISGWTTPEDSEVVGWTIVSD